MNSRTVDRAFGYIIGSMVAGAATATGMGVSYTLVREWTFEGLDVFPFVAPIGAAIGLVTGLMLVLYCSRFPFKHLVGVILPAGVVGGVLLGAAHPVLGFVAFLMGQTVVAELLVRRPSPAWACPTCTYDLRGNDCTACPECGTAKPTDWGRVKRTCRVCARPTMDDAGCCSRCGVVDEKLYRAAVRAFEEASRGP